MQLAMLIFFTSRASCLIQTFRTIKTTVSLYSSKISFGSPPTDPSATILIGKKNSLRRLAIEANLVEESIVDAMLSSGTSATTFLPSTDVKTLTLCTLPDTVSRNNHPLSVHKITSNVKSALPKHGKTSVQVCDVTQIGPVIAAVSKALPLYNRKTDLPNTIESLGDADTSVTLSCYDENGNLIGSNIEEAEIIAEAVRLACFLVDSTPEELTTNSFAAQCKLISDRFPTSVTMKEIVGSELKEKGYGGLYGVGKAADCPPRMIIMEYSPPSNQICEETVALVGKGILYDTGGLSLKSKEGMSGMKHDMAGAAGMLGGFLAAVHLRVNRKVVLILCLAENAIGPLSFRNDDILTMYSGKTVEVNNCDAEGRLVLADGVAHATKHFDCDLVVDMATLTGAQLITTGKIHAGILANKEEIEQRAIKAGKLSGDLVFPLLYAPELLMDEFKSMVADMKNSVKDRSNAQSSCAGHFIESHLSDSFKGGWLHIDMAGPGTNDQRGTGYGVGLILSLLQAPGFH
jgi:probable aminopeptidase NPEPL1